MLIHGKNSDSEINNETSSAHCKHETTMGKDICKEVEKTIAAYGLQWNN
jgi:hypothetical protein